MATSDIGKMNLSDSSDNEDLFASPSRASKKPKQIDAAPQRKEESKYDAEQAREASLQRELKSVRSINDVIEGVVNSLECAKGNMDVSALPTLFQPVLTNLVDCFAHSIVGFHASEHMDSYLITNRA